VLESKAYLFGLRQGFETSVVETCRACSGFPIEVKCRTQSIEEAGLKKPKPISWDSSFPALGKMRCRILVLRRVSVSPFGHLIPLIPGGVHVQPGQNHEGFLGFPFSGSRINPLTL